MTDLTQALKAELIRQGGYAIDWTDGGLLKTPIDAVVMGDDSDARYVDLDALAAVVEAHLRPAVTTVAELDALPVGTVVRCDDVEGIGMNVAERQPEGWQYVGSALWFSSAQLASDRVDFSVLYRPAD